MYIHIYERRSRCDMEQPEQASPTGTQGDHCSSAHTIYIILYVYMYVCMYIYISVWYGIYILSVVQPEQTSPNGTQGDNYSIYIILYFYMFIIYIYVSVVFSKFIRIERRACGSVRHTTQGSPNGTQGDHCPALRTICILFCMYICIYNIYICIYIYMRDGLVVLWDNQSKQAPMGQKMINAPYYAQYIYCFICIYAYIQIYISV